MDTNNNVVRREWSADGGRQGWGDKWGASAIMSTIKLKFRIKFTWLKMI